MRHWDLTSLPPSTEKERLREPGPDAPRVPSVDRQMPRVLFTSPECRAVVVDLGVGEELGDHHVRERAVVQVLSGRASIESDAEAAECAPGTLVTFEPGERHAVRALTETRLLLMLAPWPGPGHYTEGEIGHGQGLPANAVAEPIDPPRSRTGRPA